VRRIGRKHCRGWRRHSRFYRVNPGSGLLFKLCSRLTLINQKAPDQNYGTCLVLVSALTLLGAVYFIFAYNTFNGLWYHKVLCCFSTLVFVYMCEQVYFETYEKRIAKALPNTIKKFTHYYNHYKGNVIQALEDTTRRCPKSNRAHILKIKEALLKSDCENQTEILKHRMPSIWLKIFCNIALIAKENGGAVPGKGCRTSEEDTISNNLKRLTGIVTFINIEQGYNDAELLGMQIFVFLAPFLVIPATKWYNAGLLLDLNLDDIYRSIEAQNLTAIMMAVSGLGALFIHWMRKLRN